MNILLHPASQQRFEAYVKNPPQSILLIAPPGSGKNTTLNQLAKQILGKNSAGRLIELQPEADKPSIGIESVRELKRSLILKFDKPAIVMVRQANLLTIEAQNSLLKILEEPPKNITFLFAASSTHHILETIQSRTALWRLILPTRQQIIKFYGNHDQSLLNQALAIAGNKIGLVSSIIKAENNNNLIKDIEISKEILSENHFKRLLRVDNLCKDPIMISRLVYALVLVCKAALDSSVQNNSKSLSRWSIRLATLLNIQNKLNNNVQPRLLLSYLFTVL